MTKKVLLTDLNEPDFFHSLFNRLADFYIMNKRKVILIVAATIAVFLIIISWATYNYYYEKNAWNQYLKIEASTIKQTTSGEHADFIKQYLNLSLKYPDTQASLLCYYRLANLYYNANEIDEAIKSYKIFIAQSSDRNEFKILSYSGLAYCYESRKDYKNALQALQQAEKIDAGKSMDTFIYRDMGRLYEEMKNRDEALKCYKKALEHSIDPTFTMFIKRKIAILS